MPREITYDPAKLKLDVMTLFWAKGYSDTSLADLEAATGLNRRQLYNGIGDKRSMFLHAMDEFTHLSGQSLLLPLERDEAGIADIAELFAKFVEMSKLPEGPKGCLVCSTSQDDIAQDPSVAERMNLFFDRIRSAHLNALSRAAARKEIALDAAQIGVRADALFGTHVALCILARAGRPTPQLMNIKSQALSALN
ncbi:MAG: TetR/AcrR family transcriptional regulator [Pseudomonadota bacterium]